MKNLKDLMSKRWFANAMAGCITVAFFLVISNIGTVINGVTGFLSNFSTILEGVILAYLMNPLARYYEKTVFNKRKSESLRWGLSVALAVVTVVLSVILILVILIPQLLASITNFVSNLSFYASSLVKMLDEFGLSLSESSNTESLQNILDSSEGIINRVVDYISDNSSKIISASTSAGLDIVNWIIAFIVSIYILSAKNKIKAGVKRLMSASMRNDVYSSTITIFSRCDEILNRYIIYSLLDSFIVGIVNALLMLIFGMKYVGLVSVVVGVTNLIPTFGPMIGGIIGAFILLMVKPSHAIVFIIYSLILQMIDGYVIKPKLFGNTFGISGLLILLSIIVGGKMFGFIGILLAIPFAAICDYIYREILIPMLERRKTDSVKIDKKSETPQDSEKKETE